MARVNPRLVYWIAEVHKHPALTPAHRDILTYMAVMKLNFGTGAGYCSVRTLAEERGWHEATVKRALQLARAEEPVLLQRTRRGRRVSDEVKLASEWQLIYPPIPTAHQDDVGIPTAQRANPNVAESRSQQRTGAPPTGIEGSTGIEETTRARDAEAASHAHVEIPLR